MSYKKKRFTAILLSLTIAFAATGCGAQVKKDNGSTSSSPSSVGAATTSLNSVNADEMFSSSDKEVGYDESTAVFVTLSNNGIKCDSDAVKISENTVVIQGEGTYVFSGALDNGQIVVDAQKTDKLRIVLNGVDLNCDTSAAIYVKQADKVFITLPSGTQNTLSTLGEFVAIDENSIDSAIFSKDDLTLNGAGELTINTPYGHGIVSKDDLVITSGVYNITAASHALSGNDSIRIADGSLTLSSGKDGVHAENTDDAALGFVYIAGGDFEITSECDGISASADLQVLDGTFNIISGGGSQNGEEKPEEMLRPDARGQTAAATVADTQTVSISTKGIKATGNLVLSGGEITIDSADDALHSNANVVINEGTFAVTSGDDGIHADVNTTISGGNLVIAKSYEGIEGQSIDILGGIISVTASDDGLNAAGGNDQSGFGGGMGRDSFAADSDCYIKISGGTINADASGDGVDSNGNLYVSGGETYIAGPTNSGNSALDYNGDAQITGGIFVAVGASGMAQSFKDTSTQGVMLINLSAVTADTELLLKDSTGNTIISYTPKKAYGSVVISSPQIKQGETYTLTTGTQTATIEMTALLYGAGGETGGGGMGGGRPEGGMGKPSDKREQASSTE